MSQRLTSDLKEFPASSLKVEPLTPALWPALEDLFGPERGASGGCWCLWWRLSSREFEATSKAGRKAEFKALVEAERPLGILALQDERALGWCAVAPRADLPKLLRSRVARPLEDPSGIWMINCFYVRSGFRRSGLMPFLIQGALDYATSQGARAVEACPIEPERPLQWGEGFIGLARAFEGLGFVEVARRSPRRPLLRRDLGS